MSLWFPITQQCNIHVFPNALRVKKDTCGVLLKCPGWFQLKEVGGRMSMTGRGSAANILYLVYWLQCVSEYEYLVPKCSL